MKIPHFGLKRQYEKIKDELLDATDQVLKSGQFVGGHYTKTLEEWLRLRTGAKYVVTVHSGTQALELIARYLLSETNSPVPTITLPNISYPATLNAFLNAGWKVSLNDTDKYGISKPNVNFNCLVGLYGRLPWDQASNGSIIDGAQHWLVAKNNFGLAMAISFDPTKNLCASGNGGAIVTDDQRLYAYALNYRDNGKPSEFSTTGTNSKMSELDCAHVLVRAKYIDQWQRRRREIAEYWCKAFWDFPFRCLSDSGEYVPHAHQKFVIYSNDRNSLHTNLLLDGIDTKIHYPYVLGELHEARNLQKPDLLSTSVMLTRGVLSLPIYPELTDEEVDYIIDKVADCYKSIS